MKKFILESILFFTCCLLLLTAYGLYSYYKYNQHVSQDLVFNIPEGENFEVALMGNSGANMGKALNNKNINTASLNTLGGGVLIQKAYLDYFTQEKNTTNHIFYFVDACMLTSGQFDKPFWWRREKPDPDFVKLLLKSFDLNTVLNYLKISITESAPDGLYTRQQNAPTKAITKIDSSKVVMRINMIHKGQETVSLEQREKFLKFVDQYSKEYKQTKITFIINPTLFGDLAPNRKDLVDLLEEVKEKYNIPYYDYSDIYNSPNEYKYFYNYDHLNADGQNHLIENYLLPIMK